MERMLWDEGVYALSILYPTVARGKARIRTMPSAAHTQADLEEALEAFKLMCAIEGIIPALEPSHAIAAVARIAPTMGKDKIIIANLCGRGDKDIFTVAEALGVEM